MDRRKRPRLIALFLTLCAASASAQARDTILLIYRPDEELGQALIYQVKEAFRASKLLDFSESPADTVMTLQIETTAAVQHSLLAYSLIYTLDSRLVTTTIGTCGRNVFAQCAQSILAATDAALALVRKSLAAPPPTK